MTHTARINDVSKFLYDLMTTNINNFDPSIDDVLYGNVSMIPRASAIVVAPVRKRRELAGVAGPGGRSLNIFEVEVAIHRSAVGDEYTERVILEDLAEQAEVYIHADVTLGGIIIHGYVISAEHGNSIFLPNSMFRTIRLQFVGQTKLNITS